MEIKVLRQVAVKAETTVGTAESLTIDNVLEVFDASWNYDDRRFNRTPHRRKLGASKSRAALRFGGPRFKMEFRGSGSASTAPTIFSVLRAAGCQQEVARSIAIGAIAGGPFVHGETITGGTSSATGRVVNPTVNGATHVYYVAISGSFQNGEVLTGGTSAATATTSAVSAAAGFVLRPLTDSADESTVCSSLTAALRSGKIEHKCFGARARAKVMVNLGETVMAEIEILGIPTQPTDQALWTGTLPDPGETTPVAIGLATSLGGIYEPIFEKLEFDLGAQIVPRLSASDAQGALSYVVVDRVPKGSIDPEVVTEAVNPFLGDWYADTIRSLDFTIGSGQYNRFRFYIPQAQKEAPTEGEREGIVTHNIPFTVINEAEDDQDWSILFY
jgi:hypothetical protein